MILAYQPANCGSEWKLGDILYRTCYGGGDQAGNGEKVEHQGSV